MQTSWENIRNANETWCRTCNETANTNILHSLEKKNENYPTYANMLLELTGINIKIDKDRKFPPKHICESCSNKLKNAYAFVIQAQCVNNQFLAKLHNMSYNNVSNEQIQLEELQIKEEITTDVNDFDFDNIKQEEFISLKEQDEANSLNATFDEVDSMTVAKENFNSDTIKNQINCDNDIKRCESSSREKPQSNNFSLRCDTCGKNFIYKKSLIRHKKLHAIKCKYCELLFYRKDLLKTHLITHKKTKTNKARSLKEFLDRQDSATIAKKNLVIDNSKNEVNYTNATESLESSEIPENQNKCPIREKISNLKPQFCCTICGKIFAHKRNVVRHENIHSKSSWECRYCYRKFYRKDELKKHLMVHQKSYEAFDKQDSTPELDNVNVTENLESSEVSESETECHNPELVLNKKLQSNAELCCNICGKIFTKKSNLTRHKIVHIAKPSFKCKYCEIKFYRKDLFNNHIKIHQKSNKNERRSFNKSFDKVDSITVAKKNSDSNNSKNEVQ